MKIIAIDPGTTQSGWVHFDTATGDVLDSGVMKNLDLLGAIEQFWYCDALVYEQIAAQGMAVGFETFETVHWMGAFCHAFNRARHFEAYNPIASEYVHPVKRHEVKIALCGSAKAKDANIRQAIIDLYGGSEALKRPATCKACKGGGSVVKRGKLVEPICAACAGKGTLAGGRLGGVSSHAWSALAVALTWQKRGEK